MISPHNSYMTAEKTNFSHLFTTFLKASTIFMISFIRKHLLHKIFERDMFFWILITPMKSFTYFLMFFHFFHFQSIKGFHLDKEHILDSGKFRKLNELLPDMKLKVNFNICIFHPSIIHDLLFDINVLFILIVSNFFSYMYLNKG